MLAAWANFEVMLLARLENTEATVDGRELIPLWTPDAICLAAATMLLKAVAIVAAVVVELVPMVVIVPLKEVPRAVAPV